MLKNLVAAIAIVGSGVVAHCDHRLHGQERRQSTSPTVHGSWTITADTPHGRISMPLVLKQDGKNVTGTVGTPHGDMPIEGEFADRSLKLATTVESDRITLTATLKDDDTLAGSLSGPRGDMEWTAERDKR
jgi:hypothetical protein